VYGDAGLPVTPEHLSEAAATLTSGRGTRRARRAVALTDGRAESPPESRLRVILQLAGLTPQPQYVIRDTPTETSSPGSISPSRDTVWQSSTTARGTAGNVSWHATADG
jgi:hypothetical protein